MTLEEKISAYIKEKGIALTVISRKTGIPYMALYDSLMNEKRMREIKGRELIMVCNFLEVDPRIFADEKGGE